MHYDSSLSSFDARYVRFQTAFQFSEGTDNNFGVTILEVYEFLFSALLKRLEEN